MFIYKNIGNFKDPYNIDRNCCDRRFIGKYKSYKQL